MILAVMRESKLCYRIKTMTVKTPVNYIRRRSKTSFDIDFDFELRFVLCCVLKKREREDEGLNIKR